MRSLISCFAFFMIAFMPFSYASDYLAPFLEGLSEGMTGTRNNSSCIRTCVQYGYDLNGCVAYCNSGGSAYSLPSREIQAYYQKAHRNVDYSCVSDCRDRYSYSYCQSACSYE